MESVEPQTSARPTLLLFDVYETLLDMENVERRVNGLLDSRRGYSFWFELMMQYCFADNFLGTHHSFRDIAKATLQMAGQTLGETVTEGQAEEVVELMNHLPLLEDANHHLSLLYDNGYRMAALTNASKEIIDSRMERTGLVSFFELVMSGEEIKRYKPAKEVYEWAATRCGLRPDEIMVVSSHSWDVSGAANAGMQTAYLEQKEKLFYPLAVAPTYRFRNFEEFSQSFSGELEKS